MNKLFQLLLVEDDEDDVDLLREALKDNKVLCNVHVIMSGEKVIPHLETLDTLPDIIVLDLNLPKVHGKEVLKALKDTDKFRHIPVMIHTTSSLQSDIDECINLGADKYVNKASTIQGFKEVTEVITWLAKA